ncbi:polyketide synthase [Neorhodopirellula pilleata]|nr:polyketide synthase [Neorhodopirellula pilleata]
MSDSPHLHPKLRELLSQLRHQVRRYIVWESVLVLLAIALGVFWIAFLIDYLPVRIGGSEMPRSARGVVLVATLIAMAVFGWRYLISRYRRRLPDDSLALLIERHHPEIGGRLVTAVQLDTEQRVGDSHSPTFLASVHREAMQYVDRVDLKRVFRREPIVQKIWFVAPLLIAALIMAIASPQTFGRAIGRLTLMSDSPWPRRASLEMVGVEVPIITADESDSGATELLPFEEKVLRLARGSNATLRVRAAGEELGHVVPELCTVAYYDDDGNRGQSNLRRVGRVVDGYQTFVLDGPPLASLSKSVTLSIRGLDDRLSDFRIEAVEPPAIANLEMRVRYPNYLRVFDDMTIADEKAVDQTLNYQAGVRIREGSRLTLVGSSSIPLGSVDVTASSLETTGATNVAPIDANRDEQAELNPDVEIAEDGMSFSLTLPDLREAVSIRMVPRDPTGISAQAAYRYFIGVVRDQIPETTMRLTGIGSAITPIAKLPVVATAKDDYGIESVQVLMNVQGKQDESETSEPLVQTHVLSPVLDRDGKTNLTIDLRTLTDDKVLQPIQPGAMVTIGTTAKDRFDLSTPHITQGELTRLQVVTPEELLASLERRELEFRSRLEQAIDETRRLKQSLTGIDGETAELAMPTEDELRSRQRVQLRIRQAELQAAKTTEELAGIVSGIDDLLLEMLNNRIDSVDRRERLQTGVRDPLNLVVTEPFPRLRRQIVELERILMTQTVASDGENESPRESSPESGSQADSILKMRQAVTEAVATNDEILLQLSAVLEKMLDLESFNEILDLMRGLIDDQESLLDETEDAQKKRVLDLFK